MSLFSHFSQISRQRKFELFSDLMKPTEQTKILDVGAQVAPPGGNLRQQLIDRYPWKHNISAINISSDHVKAIQRLYPQIDAQVGDARRLPWPDKTFDIVYSNAVIEHVGGVDDQRQMASEVMRVGKRWFITTPNRWFPFEFHLRLPFVTWLPGQAYLWMGSLVRYSHERRRYVFLKKKPTGLRLMTAKELKTCFRSSQVIAQRVTFMAETLIVVGGDDESALTASGCRAR